MKLPSLTLTRRAALAAPLFLGLAPRGIAAQPVRTPLRCLYARVEEGGFAYLDTDEKLQWSRFALRLGGLAARIEPMPPAPRLLPSGPGADTGASCALFARKATADLGLDAVILYATSPQKTGRGPLNALRPANWMAGRSLGEAHMLGLDSGTPLVSVAAEGSDPMRNPLSPGKSRDVALDRLLHALEDRVRALVQDGSLYPASIAD